MALMQTIKQRQFRRSIARRQAGMALGELLVLTLPLCLLCLILASKLAATSSARIHGQWQVAHQVEMQSTRPCGMDAELTAPFYTTLVNSKVDKAWPILGISLLPDGGFSNGLPAVSKKQESLITKLPKYFYQKLADKLLPDGINQIETSAMFVCNEPGDPNDSARGAYALKLEALSGIEAGKLFGIGPGVPGTAAPLIPGDVNPPPPDSKPPENKPPTYKARPTLDDMLKDPTVDAALKKAWQESNSDAKDVPLGQPGSTKQEQGGWIVWNKETGHVEIIRVPAGTRDGLGTMLSTRPPDNDKQEVIGWFHTHPNTSAEGYVSDPSPGDRGFQNGYAKVPGIIETHDGRKTIPYP